ncbi:aminotransferase class V-fold PLP-dependent enzyme [Falsiroseomonas sp. CW058]|uniref:aminotransferase class V-fold PLP-dependent enzyme n=1 Tax=Falsiroseomonas sp. CW058 TaxID=3388664 RepID=UPI003D310DE0
MRHMDLPGNPAAETDALLRAAFRDLGSTVYLDVAARGPLPFAARRAAEAMLLGQASGAVPKLEWFAMAERTRAKAARLLGVAPGDLAFTKNASEGLNIVAASLRLGRGDRIVIAPSVEHPNNVFPWLWQAEQAGAELHRVTPAPGEPLEDALAAALDGRTRLVAVTSMDFATGRRTDLRRIGTACRARDVFLLVDAAQSAGVLAEDLSGLPVDGWATAAQKGLLGLYGLGLLYVRRDRAEMMRPVHLARFSVELAEGHEAAGPDGGWRLRDGAGRFEVGNHNFVALAALEASLDLLLRLGPAEVERRSTAAAAALRAGIEALGLPVLPVPPAHRGHIVAVGEAIGSGHDTADLPWVNALGAHLRAAGVVHSVRRGVLRLSTHVHVLPEVAGRALDVIADWRGDRSG